MPVIAELHSFTSINGGYQCTTCSAFISDAILQSNDPSQAQIDETPPNVLDNQQDVINFSYKKAGLP